jgi:hypothetical protein
MSPTVSCSSHSNNIQSSSLLDRLSALALGPTDGVRYRRGMVCYKGRSVSQRERERAAQSVRAGIYFVLLSFLLSSRDGISSLVCE